MHAIKKSDLNCRQILIQNYKELGLNETELVVLLLIDSLSQERSSLITGEQLEIKMNLKASEIDAVLVTLMNKSFLSYDQEGGITVTSMKRTYDRLIDFMEKKIADRKNEEVSKQNEDAMSRVLKTLEEEMKHPLTPLDIDLVSTWFKDDVGEEVINAAINECIMKGGKVSVKQVDRMIIKNLTHHDRVKEGFTTVDEKTKRDIKKAIDIASYDWVNRDED